MAKAVILGGGESGYGSAVLAKEKGFETFLSDFSAISTKYADLLRGEGIEFEQGGHTMERILDADIIIKSPGIPETAPVIKAVREKGIDVISEIEFASRYTRGKLICITGSNGKTTTTTLTHRILETAGWDVAVGGNIGQSFALSVARSDREWYVLELSSFQLDGCYTLKPLISVIMNITPDHLDRYGHVFQNYIDSKMRIIRNQDGGDTFIHPLDCPTTAAQIERLKPGMRLVPFGRRLIAEDGSITLSAGGRSLILDSGRFQIKGLHNAYDIMAASLAALAAGVPAEAIESAVYSFEGVEHRLEKAGTVDGVVYVNDSKATNVDSVWYALESMTGPTVWIAGGTDKGNDYAPLDGFVREKVKALVCMGKDNAKLISHYGQMVPTYDTDSLEKAMAACRSIAVSGDTVLLSPACASFDLFSNYEDRGRQFKQAVAAMTAERSNG